MAPSCVVLDVRDQLGAHAGTVRIEFTNPLPVNVHATWAPLSAIGIEKIESTKAELSEEPTLKHISEIERLYPNDWSKPTLLEATCCAGVPMAEDVIAACQSVLPRISKTTWNNCFFLSPDDATAITLYTYDFALRKLPRVGGKDVVLYRGITKQVNLCDYPVGKTLIWHGFTSTTTDMGTTKQFICSPSTGFGTLFVLRNCWGYDVQPFSYLPGEREILLEPGIEFQVASVLDSYFIIIELEMYFQYKFQSEISRQDPESITSVITKLKFFSHFESVALSALDALAKIAQSDTNRRIISAHGGTDVVVSTLKEHNELPQVCEYVCIVLGILAKTKENRTQISRRHGSEIVFEAMKKHMSQPLLQQTAFNTLITMAVREDGEISDSDAVTISESLKLNSAITEFNLENIKLSDSAARVLFDALKLHHSITKVALNGIFCDGMIMFYIEQALSLNTVIQELNFMYNKKQSELIGDECAFSIACAFHNKSRLKTVNLSGNGMGPEGAPAIAEILCKVVHLNLSGTTMYMHHYPLTKWEKANHIGSKGAQEIFEALKLNTSLTELDLSVNEIDDVACSFTEMLQCNGTLHDVNLSGNKIGDSAAKEIAAVLGRKGGVKMNLSCNLIGSAGRESIFTALQSHPYSTVILDVTTNGLLSLDVEPIPTKEHDTLAEQITGDEAPLLEQTATHTTINGPVSVDGTTFTSSRFTDDLSNDVSQTQFTPSRNESFESMPSRLTLDFSDSTPTNLDDKPPIDSTVPNNSTPSELLEENSQKLNTACEFSTLFEPIYTKPTLLEALTEAGIPQIELVLQSCTQFLKNILPKHFQESCFLSLEDALGLIVYTYEFSSPELVSKNPSTLLNQCLQERNKEKIRSVRGLLYLLLLALRKLPRVGHNCVLYRGVTRRLPTSEISVGQTLTWHCFTSTTTDISSTKQLLSETSGTLFVIRNCWGYNIQPFSFSPGNQEILLEPWVEFHIVSVLTAGFIVVEMEMQHCPSILKGVVEGVKCNFENEIGTQDSLRAIIEKLQSFFHLEPVAISACKALTKAAQSYQNKRFIGEIGGVSAVLLTLKEHINLSLEACESAASALGVIGKEKSNRLYLLQNGAVEYLLSSTKTYPNSTQFQQTAFNALMSLVVNELGYLGDSGAFTIAKALKRTSSITDLNLSVNKIGDEGTKPIAKALRKNVSIRNLNLRENLFSAEGAQSIAEVLVQNSTITEIDISYNKILEPGGKVIAEALKSNLGVVVLKMEGTLQGSACSFIAETLAVNNVIRELHLGVNNIGDLGATAVGHALSHNSSLRILDLKQNSIGPFGAQALSKYLKENTTLSNIDLRANNIESDGLRYLLQALQIIPCIKIILSGNPIGSPDIITQLAKSVIPRINVFEKVGKEPCFVDKAFHLDCSENGINDAGAQALAELIKSQQILDVTVAYNEYENSAEAIARELQRTVPTTVFSPILTADQPSSPCIYLNLSKNNIGNTGTQALIIAIQQNPALKSLNLQILPSQRQSSTTLGTVPAGLLGMRLPTRLSSLGKSFTVQHPSHL
ncbi:Protein NLRC3 [Pelomyxa schiedti]|nr:Protein NLRC3 [Pelomyxa schiedti]